VFGYRGGRAAATLAAERPWKPKSAPQQEALIIQAEAEKLEPVRASMDKALMVVRRKENLVELLDKIHAFRQEVSVLDTATDNLLLAAETIAGSALLREESRGAHYREDFQSTDPAYAKSSLIRKGKGGETEAFLA